MNKSDVSLHQPNVQTVAPGANGHHEAGLLDVLGIVRRRLWLIVFGLALGIGLGVLYHSKTTPMYESKVEILVMPKDSSLPSQNAGNNDFQQQSADEDTLATHIQMFQSPRIVGDAFENANLGALPSLAEVIADEKNPIAHIIDNLEVTRGGEGKAKDASVLSATYTGPSADDCVVILDALVESYQNFLGATFQDTSEDAVTLITEAMNELGEDLTAKEDAYHAFRLSAPLLWNGEDSLNIHQERLASAETTLSEIAVSEAETNARLAVIEEALAAADGRQLSDVECLALLGGDIERLSLLVTVTDEKEDLAKSRREEAGRREAVEAEYERMLSLLLEEITLLQDYSDDHPEVLAIRQRIEVTRDFLEKHDKFSDEDEIEATERITPAGLLAAHIGLLKHDVNELAKRRAALESLAEREEVEAKKMATYEIEDKLKNAELERLHELHDAVVARLGEMNLIKDYGGFLTEIIAPVERADKPCWPVLPIVIGLGGLCGLFLGCGLAYLVELSDRSFRSPEELHHTLRLPIMAHIPVGSKRKKRRARTEDGSREIDPSIVVAHRPASRFAEVFRGLRTALRFSATGADCRVIQVTSANPSDGKTTVAANLAVSIAQSGKRVLLVDADLRRPRVAAAFGIQAESGLTQVLKGEAEVVDAATESGVENLWILPCGKKPSNPAEILSSRTFERFVETVREQYDLVIIDSPPVLAVSDPAIIAPRVDGVLLTIRLTKHGRPQVIQARESLASLGANILGIIVNGSGKSVGYGYGNSQGYTSGSGYGYGYGYGGSNNSSASDNHYYADKDQESVKA